MDATTRLQPTHLTVSMLSSALSEVLERARTRFGVEVEILDSDLRTVYATRGAGAMATGSGSASLHRMAREVLAAGHPRDIEEAGVWLRLYPLHVPGTIATQRKLLAVKTRVGEGRDMVAGGWSEFARVAIEADLSAGSSLTSERHHSRQLMAALRFLSHLIETTSETDIVEGLVQAAAVWFDLDARVYRRDATGDFVLHHWLPGAELDDGPHRLAGPFGSDTAGDAAAAPGPVLALAAAAPPEWLLMVSGAVAHDATAVLQVVSRVAGLHLEALRARRADEARRRFELLARQGRDTLSSTVSFCLRELVDATGAASASFTVVTPGGARCVATVGRPAPHGAETIEGSLFTAEHAVLMLPLPGDGRGVLYLAAAEAPLAREAHLLARACAEVLQAWLSGSGRSLEYSSGTWDTVLEQRIEEELERANRLDLHLSVVVIEVSAPPPALTHVKEALRPELRHTDVLGTTRNGQLAALLTHTDPRGSNTVFMRLRRKLADTAEELKLAEVRLGQAALSSDCRTADALLTHAARHAERLVTH